MNTPAHLIFGLAAFGRPGEGKVIAGALVGALLPDLSLYVLAGVSLFVLGISPDRVFGELYFSDSWQLAFAIDNSLVLWGLGLGLALWLRIPWAVALTGAALLHIGLDLPLHHDDGRPHFWPVSNWVFESPVSYWDPARYGNIVGPIETLITLGLCIWLWRRHTTWGMRTLVVSLALGQLAPVIIWATMFGG